MSKVITFSRFFQKNHPRAGEPTNFIEKFWRSRNYSPSKHEFSLLNVGKENIADGVWCGILGNNDEFEPKHHTIRPGNRFKVGEKFSPRVWSSVPYYSKQIAFAPDIEIKKIWAINIMRIEEYCFIVLINGKRMPVSQKVELSTNDGLNYMDFVDWFDLKLGQSFNGQIICWSEEVEY